MRQQVTRGWTLSATGGAVPPDLAAAEVPATVPGCVHTDLLSAGLIPDPYLDEVEAELRWVGRTAWRYATSLDTSAAAPGERVELVFDGLDTVCEIALNGERLGAARNMHRTHRFDVTALVRDGHNELVVDFAAQLDTAEQASDEQGPRVHTNAHPFNAVRKMACNFGWDWGPDLVTAGIWRPVHLHRWHMARLGGLRCLATVVDGVGRVEVHAEVVQAPAASDSAPLVLRAEVAGVSAEATVSDDGSDSPQSAQLVLEVPEPPLWWPRGHGQQPLHDLVVTLSHGSDELERQERRVGFRSVELDTQTDEHGTPFTLRVNGRPILVKGANWIPDDCFPSRVDRARYAARVADAVDAGMNLLRVWGGGIYESDDFYDVCDEEGILVWQDFLFACAAYPEEALVDEVVAEVTDAVTRLSAHPSLAVWNGNNENLWGYVDWSWREQLGDLSWGKGYYLELLPTLLAELDPTRPYSPGSPWSFDESRHPNDPAHGTMHIWDVWNTADYTAYRSYVPRFVSEFGYQGPPAWATLRRAVHDDPLTPTSPGMLSHQKAADGDRKLRDGIAPHLELPTDIEDWHWATSLQQARAVTYAVEHFRSWHPVCAGMVVWQLNDCWPVTSWAAVDGDGRRKPLWFALRRAYADRLLTIQPRDDELVLAVCNDTDEVWQGDLTVRRMTFSGAHRTQAAVPVTVPARSTQVVPLAPDLVEGAQPADEVVVAQLGEARAVWFFAEDRDLALVDAWKSASADITTTGYAVHVTAEALQRDVTLLVDKVDPDATVDDSGVTLLPGESHTFQVRSSRSVDPHAFLGRTVLRSTNQLVRPAESRSPR